MLKSDSKSTKEEIFSITISVMISTLIFTSIMCTTSFTAEGSSSDLVVETGEEKVIQNTEYGIKGAVWIREGGTLSIRDTYLTIYQDYNRQFDIHVSEGGTLILDDSVLSSSHSLDITFEQDSVLIADGSVIDINGDLTGDLTRLDIKDSEVEVSSMNLDIQEANTDDSYFTASSTVLSLEEGEFRQSIFQGELYLRGDGTASLNNTVASEITVREDIIVEIYRKLDLEALDRADIPVGGSSVMIRRQDTGELIEEEKTSERRRRRRRYRPPDGVQQLHLRRPQPAQLEARACFRPRFLSPILFRSIHP